MTDQSPGRGMGFVPRSTFLVWLNLAVTFVVAAIGFGLGFAQGLSAQVVILYTLISAAVLFWLINYVTVVFESRLPRVARSEEAEIGRDSGRGARRLARQPRAHRRHGAAAACLPHRHGIRAGFPHHHQPHRLPGPGGDPGLRLQGLQRLRARPQRLHRADRPLRADRDHPPSPSTGSCRAATSRRSCSSPPFLASLASGRPWWPCLAGSTCRSPSSSALPTSACSTSSGSASRRGWPS